MITKIKCWAKTQIKSVSNLVRSRYLSKSNTTGVSRRKKLADILRYNQSRKKSAGVVVAYLGIAALSNMLGQLAIIHGFGNVWIIGLLALGVPPIAIWTAFSYAPVKTKRVLSSLGMSVSLFIATWLLHSAGGASFPLWPITATFIVITLVSALKRSGSMPNV